METHGNDIELNGEDTPVIKSEDIKIRRDKSNAVNETLLLTKRVNTRWSEIFMLIVSISLLMFDVYSDIILIITYGLNGDHSWALLTLLFISVPTLMYMLDGFLMAYEAEGWPLKFWIGLMTVLQMGIFIRYYDELIDAWGSNVNKQKAKPNKKRSDDIRSRVFGFTKDMDDTTKATRLRLAEALTEACPQCCLQLYIMSIQGHDALTSTLIIQFISVVSSLSSIAWAICAWHRENDFMEHGHNIELSFLALLPLFLSHIFMISARVLAIAMFANYFKSWTFVLLGIHVIFMFVFNFVIYINHGLAVNLDDKKLCCLKGSANISRSTANVSSRNANDIIRGENDSCKDVNDRSRNANDCGKTVTYTLKIIGLSAFQLYAEMNYSFKEEDRVYKRVHVAFQGLLMYGENLGMIITWYVQTADNPIYFYRLPVFIVVLTGMFLGEVFLEIYNGLLYEREWNSPKGCTPTTFALGCLVFLVLALVTKVCSIWSKDGKTSLGDDGNDEGYNDDSNEQGEIFSIIL